jgi:hypothetical protein
MTTEIATQLRRLVDETDDQFERAQEEKEKATEAFQKKKYKILEQLRAAQASVASCESEKEDLRVKLQEEKRVGKSQLQNKKSRCSQRNPWSKK